MLILLPPAKTFKNTNQKCLTNHYFKNETNEILNILKEFSIFEIEEKFKVSSQIAVTAYKYINNPVSKPSIYSYFGTVYKYLDVANIKFEDLEKYHILTVSTLYGFLKPYDEMSYYRLDFTNTFIMNFYDYWQPKLYNYLEKYHHNDLIISLLSNEFEKAIQYPHITIEFVKNNKKTLSFEAKKMRGLFANHIITNNLKTLDDLMKIKLEGYEYNKHLSKENLLTFVYK